MKNRERPRPGAQAEGITFHINALKRGAPMTTKSRRQDQRSLVTPSRPGNAGHKSDPRYQSRFAKRCVGLTVQLVIGFLVQSGGQGAPAHATLGIIADNRCADNQCNTTTSGSAVIFDTTSQSVVGTVPLFQSQGPTALDCAVNPAETLGFVTAFEGGVNVIDLTASPPTLTDFIQTSNPGEDTSLTVDGRFLLICDGVRIDPTQPPSEPVSVVDVALRKEVSATFLTTDCQGVEVCSDGSVLTLEASTIRRWTLTSTGALNDTGEKLDDPNGNFFNVTCAPDSKSGIALSGLGTVVSFTIPGLIPVTTIAALPATQGQEFPVSAVIDPTGTRAFILGSCNLPQQHKTCSAGVNDLVYGYDFDSTTGVLNLASGPDQIPTPGELIPYFGADQMAQSPDFDGTLYVSQTLLPSMALVNPTTHKLIKGKSLKVTGPVGVCLPSVSLANYLAACGNGILDLGEQCDDGNADSGDGCSNRCEVESCYKCTTPGRSCTVAAAGAACADDHNECTNDVCDGAGRCNQPMVGAPCADDGNPCTDTGVCNSTGLCAHDKLPDGTLCDDGLFCNGVDSCQDGTCVQPGNPCGVCGTCDELTQSCGQAKPDGTLCNQPLGCSLDDNVCDNGACSVSQSCDPQYAESAFALDEVTLRPTAKSGAPTAKGTIRIRGKLDRTSADLDNKLTSGGLTVDILDGAGGTIDTLTWAANECYGAPGSLEVCQHRPDPKSTPNKAVFRTTKAAPGIYKVTITAGHRTISSPLNMPPVRVRLETTGLNSRDDMSQCKSRGKLAVHCVPQR
jgi:cysteine-rich repeat protein